MIEARFKNGDIIKTNLTMVQSSVNGVYAIREKQYTVIGSILGNTNHYMNPISVLVSMGEFAVTFPESYFEKVR